MNKRSFTIFIMMTAVIILTGCGSLRKVIIGKWESGQATVMEHTDYSPAILTSSEIVINSEGIIYLDEKPFDYRWIDDGQIQVGDENGEILKVSINNGALVLKHEKSKTEEQYEVVLERVGQ